MPVFEDFVISPDASLRQAMERMTANARGLVLVCDQGCHLVGVLSDGDARRAMLRGTLLVSPVHQWMNADPLVASEPAVAKELLHRAGALAVPVIDGGGRVVSLVIRAAGDSGESLEILFPTPEAEHLFEDPPEAEWEIPKAVAVVPARGGSKRLPGKNLAELAGRSLVARAVDSALGARLVARTLVSTDDPAIAEEARSAGAEVPWLRPAELAGDRVPSLDVLRHALRHMVAQDPEIAIVLLVEPTAPLRTAEVLDRAVELLATHPDADSVVSVSRVPHTLHPDEMLVSRDGVLKPYTLVEPVSERAGDAAFGLDHQPGRRQQEPVWVRNGWVYATRTTVVLEDESLYGRRSLPLELPWHDFVDVDTEDDLADAEDRLRRLGPSEDTERQSR